MNRISGQQGIRKLAKDRRGRPSFGLRKRGCLDPAGDSLFNDHPFDTYDAGSGRRPPHHSRRGRQRPEETKDESLHWRISLHCAHRIILQVRWSGQKQSRPRFCSGGGHRHDNNLGVRLLTEEKAPDRSPAPCHVDQPRDTPNASLDATRLSSKKQCQARDSCRDHFWARAEYEREMNQENANCDVWGN
jgi:hypothetical protein